MKSALTIAGSDSSGGVGIQADIKTMCANHVFATSAITALTAQNTLGVTGIMDVIPEFLGERLDAVFTDIYPDAVKIGMVSSSSLIEMIAKKLKEYKAENIVVDPVMVATSGARLISEDAIETLKKELLPLATLITPNIPEAEVLSEMDIMDEESMVEAAKKSVKLFDALLQLRAVIKSMMRMIYYIEMIHLLGLKGNVSIIQIHMVRVALCRAQSHQILRKDLIWMIR